MYWCALLLHNVSTFHMLGSYVPQLPIVDEREVEVGSDALSFECYSNSSRSETDDLHAIRARSQNMQNKYTMKRRWGILPEHDEAFALVRLYEM